MFDRTSIMSSPSLVAAMTPVIMYTQTTGPA